MRAAEAFIAWDELEPRIRSLWDACQLGDCETARGLLLDTVTEYQPSNDIDDLVWRRRKAMAVGNKGASITDIAARCGFCHLRRRPDGYNSAVDCIHADRGIRNGIRLAI